MRIRRNHLVFLSALSLVVGCSGEGNQGTGATGGGGNGGAGGAGGMGVQIEKPENAIDGQYIFLLDAAKVMPDMVKSVAEELLATQGGVLLQVYDGEMVGFAANNLDDAKALDMAKDPRITEISQDFVVEIQSIQSNAPWGLDRIDSPQLSLDSKYEYYLRGDGIHVFVLDTGIRASHGEFGGRVDTANGKDFINDGNGTEDCNGHGTHVAGIIGGATYGVAKGVTLHPIRIADCQGKSSGSLLIAGMEWVRTHPQRPAVVNIGMGAPVSTLLDKTATNLNATATPVIVAAGNAGTDACASSPGRLSWLHTVGATDNTDTRAALSNYGGCVKVFAPGVDIASASHMGDNEVTTLSGTSQAAAFVSGVVAQYLELDPAASVGSSAYDNIRKNVFNAAPANIVKNAMGSSTQLIHSGVFEKKGSFGAPSNWSADFSDASGWASAPRRWQTIDYADLNGDGLDDVCAFAAPGIACALNTGAGAFGATSIWSSAIADGTGWEQEIYYPSIKYVDVSGDGKADLCGRSSLGVGCAISTGTSFGPMTTWGPAYSDAAGWSSNPSYHGTIRYADINGDGKIDVCGRNGNGALCALSTGTTFDAASLWSPAFSDAAGWNLSDSNWATIQHPDVNGDGKADLCARSKEGLRCGLSTGTAFGAVSLWDFDSVFSDASGWATQPGYWTTIQYADLNGDKKADVCGRSKNGMICARSEGTFFWPPTIAAPDFGDAQGWLPDQNYYGSIRLVDVTGDGLADICSRNGNGMFCGYSAGNKFAYVKQWDTTYTDAMGWAQYQFMQTERFPRLNNDKKRDVCIRGTNGLICELALP